MVFMGFDGFRGFVLLLMEFFMFLMGLGWFCSVSFVVLRSIYSKHNPTGGL